MSLIKNIFGLKKEENKPLDLSGMGQKYEANPVSGVHVLEIGEEQTKKPSDVSVGPTRILTDPSESKTPKRQTFGAQDLNQYSATQTPIQTNDIGTKSPIFSSKQDDTSVPSQSRRKKRHHYYDFEDNYKSRNSAKSSEHVTNS